MSFRLHCPHCDGTQHWKWNKPTWMFLTPGPMDNQRCSVCGREYTVWFGIFPIRQTSSRSMCRVWHWILLVLLFAFVALVLPFFLR